MLPLACLGVPTGPIRHRGRRNAVVGGEPVDRCLPLPADITVGWLLRMNRLHRLGEGRATTRQFAREMSAMAGSVVTFSAVSRWERAEAKPSANDVARYEELLDVETGQLVAVADLVHEGISRNVSDRSISEFQQLLECAVAGDPLSSVQWLTLANGLVRPVPTLMPNAAWRQVAKRLIHETAVSCGWRYWQRFKALEALCLHPEGGRAIVAVVGDLLEQPDSQVLMDPAAVLAHVDSKEALQTMFGRLRNPASENVLRAMLVAWSVRAAATEIEPQLRRSVAALAADYLADRTMQMSTKAAAADLLATLRSVGPVALSRGTSNAIDYELRSTLDRRASVPDEVSRPVLKALQDTVYDAMAVETEDDQLLEPLLFQAVFSTNVDLRVRAGNVLGASPFGGPVAARIAQMLNGDPIVSADAVASLATALGKLGGAEHRQVLESVMQSSRSSPDAVIESAMALGHLPGTTPPTVWNSVLACRQGSDLIGRAVLYGAGMNRDDQFLIEASENRSFSSGLRHGAKWWRSVTDGVGREVR